MRTLTVAHWRVNETQPPFSEAKAGSLEIGDGNGGRIYGSIEDAKAEVARYLDNEDFLYALALAYLFERDPDGKGITVSKAEPVTVTFDLAADTPLTVAVPAGAIKVAVL